MFEKFLYANAADFRQRYEGTHGFFRNEAGKRTLVQLTAIDKTVCIFLDAHGVEYRLNADTDKDIGFEFLPPKSGYFNVAEGTWMVARIPARQFQRGISGRNTAIYRHFAGGMTPVKVNIKNLEAIYADNISYLEAFELFHRKGLESVALSSSFALGHHAQLYLYTERIGVWDKQGDNYKLMLKEPGLFTTELKDAVKTLPAKFEVCGYE